MNEAVLRRTQEALGPVIRKPPLTDRLLSKPPFRYLHDVITEVIRVTGFMKGLYTDFELKSDNVKDKDAKISFLQKAIDAVVMVTGEPLSVKPARVVAGHEPEKTNEFLQAIGKCCLNKLSSDAAVKRILAGERADAKEKPPTSKSREKESRESKSEVRKSHKESRGGAEIKDRSSSGGRRAKGELKESEEREKESNKHKDNEDRHKDHERERSRSRTTKQGKETEKHRSRGDIEQEDELKHDKGQEREKKYEGAKDTPKERDKDKARDREREKDREKRKDRERDRKRDREKDGEHLREHGNDKAEKKSADAEESTHRKPRRPTEDGKCQPDHENESSPGISRQPSTKGTRQHARPRGEAVEMKSVADRISEDSVAKLEEKAEPGLEEKEGEVEDVAPEKPAENGEVPLDLPPQPIQRRIPRPGSARPAPPRVKRPESAELLPPERIGSGKTVSNVITDQQNSDDDDDQFVVEAALPLPEVPHTEMEPEVELVEDQKHGGLVKRLLETKKDYEASQISSKTTEREKSFVSETDRKRERDLVAKEIEKFQVSIQNLCKSALTLGRIMDYIQEDMDAMKNELQMWRQENRQHAETLQKEQSITDSAVEPLKADLAELNQLIKDQQDKICAVRANIIKNEEKIRRMVLSINLSSKR
ncbi:TRAF3-interacting protein 1 isoform X2 [Melopsittacus undulatus]|uniref:TRAF3-interacting protein 1 isoform X2 n=1 Tax=Melopsittacus undulatus TaxID=13146 RepID=UPI00146F3C63|nr:TRAF3-interacting protein 1 isoform X2 [Melopsittacus undulatus]